MLTIEEHQNIQQQMQQVQLQQMQRAVDTSDEGADLLDDLLADPTEFESRSAGSPVQQVLRQAHVHGNVVVVRPQPVPLLRPRQV